MLTAESALMEDTEDTNLSQPCQGDPLEAWRKRVPWPSLVQYFEFDAGSKTDLIWLLDWTELNLIWFDYRLLLIYYIIILYHICNLNLDSGGCWRGCSLCKFHGRFGAGFWRSAWCNFGIIKKSWSYFGSVRQSVGRRRLDNDNFNLNQSRLD